jgi:hypothetical protein
MIAFPWATLALSTRRSTRGIPGLELKAHPHMLRHACGYALANKGHDTRAIQGWLGHRSITSTAVYTALARNRFKDFWRIDRRGMLRERRRSNGQKNGRRRFNERLQEGRKGRGQALKKGGGEDRQNHQALAQERRNLGGRQAKNRATKLCGWMSISASAERLHRATLWRLAGGRTYSPSSFGIPLRSSSCCRFRARAAICDTVKEGCSSTRIGTVSGCAAHLRSGRTRRCRCRVAQRRNKRSADGAKSFLPSLFIRTTR